MIYYILNAIFIFYFIYVCVDANIWCGQVYNSMTMEVREQLHGVCSLLPSLHVSQVLNLGC